MAVFCQKTQTQISIHSNLSIANCFFADDHLILPPKHAPVGYHSDFSVGIVRILGIDCVGLYLEAASFPRLPHWNVKLHVNDLSCAGTANFYWFWTWSRVVFTNNLNANYRIFTNTEPRRITYKFSNHNLKFERIGPKNIRLLCLQVQNLQMVIVSFQRSNWCIFHYPFSANLVRLFKPI